MTSKVNYSCVTILAILFALSYYDTLHWMLGRYLSVDSYYSHGFLIPFVTGYLIWLKREELAEVDTRTSWVGFSIVLLAALAHIFGTASYIFSISGFSIWFLLVGSCLFIYGWPRIRIIFFPLIFLIFMFPVPSAFINEISFPLKMSVANYSVKLVALSGVPVFREGFNITIPQGNLLVDDPCSGLRSLITFLALGSLFAYLSTLSITRKWVLFLLSVPIALLSNLIRVPAIIFWSYKYGLAAAAPDTLFHTGSGFVVFLLGSLMLYFAMHCLGGNRES